MPNFMYIYHAPPPPPDTPEPSHEEMQEVMGHWMAWSEQVGDGMVDFGTPLGAGKRVTSDGAQDSSSDVTGYTIIEAEDMDAALALARVHPHLNMPGGCEIELYEVQPIPGM